MTITTNNDIYDNIDFFNTLNVNNYPIKLYKVLNKKNIDYFNPSILFSSVRGDYITLKNNENIDMFPPSNIDIHLYLYNHNLN